MLEHVSENTVDDDYIICGAVEGQLPRLKFDSLHDGIVKMGDFHVACGDSNAHDRTCYDLKMLVAEKRKYHVEN